MNVLCVVPVCNCYRFGGDLSTVGNNLWLWLLISHQPAAYLGIVLATTESDVASESAFAALRKPISLLSSAGQS